MGCAASSLRDEPPRKPPPAKGASIWAIPPLHWAAWQGDERRVAALLAGQQGGGGCSSNQLEPGRDGWSALHFAVRGGSAACLRLLLDASARPDAVARPTGHTALHWAAAAGAGDCVAALLAAGADAGVADGLGRTSLQYAEQRLAEAEAAEQRSPYQQSGGELVGARLAVRLLRAAAQGQLPQPAAAQGQLLQPAVNNAGSVADESAAEEPQKRRHDGKPGKMLPSATTPNGAAPDTPPPLGSRAASAASLGSSCSLQSSSGGSSTAGVRECRVCLQEANELLALVPCGHRATCGACTARLLLPALMQRWAQEAAAEAAAAGTACLCPVCRGSVTGSLRVYDC